MGRVDLHYFRCKKVAPCIKSRKWTWSVLLQSSLVNASVLWNMHQEKAQEKVKTRDLCIEVSKTYCQESTEIYDAAHKHTSKERQTCSVSECKQRTTRYCLDCKNYYFAIVSRHYMQRIRENNNGLFTIKEKLWKMQIFMYKKIRKFLKIHKKYKKIKKFKK